MNRNGCSSPLWCPVCSLGGVQAGSVGGMSWLFRVQDSADNLEALSGRIQKLRWKIRVATGFNPSVVEIPKRFTEVTTWKGKVDGIICGLFRVAMLEGSWKWEGERDERS